MNVKELSSKKMFREYLIEIPYVNISDSLDQKIKEIIPTITLPGFRKGKAPLNIVKKKYENNIISDIMRNIIQENTKKLLEEKKLKPLRQPKVEVTKYKKDEPVELNLKIDLQPELTLIDFTKNKTKKYEIKIDKATYEKNYNNYIKSQKTYSKLVESRTIKKGDKLNVSLKSKDKFVPEFLSNQEDITIITDSDYQILPNISDELIKKKVKSGDKIILPFDLKDILKEKNKKIATFEIEIKSIEEQKNIKIDKNFLDKNNFKSEKDFKEKINENLKNHYNNYLKEIEKKQIFDLLESNHKFDLPERIYDEEFNHIWQKVQTAKENKSLDEDDKNISDTQLKKRYEKIATRRVKLAIIIQIIAEQNSIVVTNQELSDGLMTYASQYPGQEKQIFEYFKNNPSQMESIRAPIFENKVMEHVLSKTTKEKEILSIDKFKKLHEETFSYNKEN